MLDLHKLISMGVKYIFTNFIAVIAVSISICSYISADKANVIATEANVIAKESNEIASQQANPSLVVLNFEDVGGTWGGISPKRNTLPVQCFFKLRLVNVGGAPTSIVAYTILMLYQNESVAMSSTAVSARPIPRDASLSPIISPAASLISPSLLAPEIMPGSFKPSLPLKIGAHDTLDIYFNVDFSYDTRIRTIQSPWYSSREYSARNGIIYDPAKLVGFDPIDVVIELLYDVKQAVRTNQEHCWYIK